MVVRGRRRRRSRSRSRSRRRRRGNVTLHMANVSDLRRDAIHFTHAHCRISETPMVLRQDIGDIVECVGIYIYIYIEREIYKHRITYNNILCYNMLYVII